MKLLWIIAIVCAAGFGLGAYMAASSPQFWLAMGGALLSALSPFIGKLLKPAPPLTEEQRERIKDGEPEARVRQFPIKTESKIVGLAPSKDIPKK